MLVRWLLTLTYLLPPWPLEWKPLHLAWLPLARLSLPELPHRRLPSTSRSPTPLPLPRRLLERRQLLLFRPKQKPLLEPLACWPQPLVRQPRAWPLALRPWVPTWWPLARQLLARR